MRASKFDGAKKTTDAPFELPEASAVRRTNAHQSTAVSVTNILLSMGYQVLVPSES